MNIGRQSMTSNQHQIATEITKNMQILQYTQCQLQFNNTLDLLEVGVQVTNWMRAEMHEICNFILYVLSASFNRNHHPPIPWIYDSVIISEIISVSLNLTVQYKWYILGLHLGKYILWYRIMKGLCQFLGSIQKFINSHFIFHLENS